MVNFELIKSSCIRPINYKENEKERKQNKKKQTKKLEKDKEGKKKKRLQKISICVIKPCKFVVLNNNFSLYSYFVH